MLYSIGHMMSANQIQPFNCEGDAVDWTNWLNAFEIFKKAAQSMHVGAQPDWCALLLFYAGPKVQQVYASLNSAEQPHHGPLADELVLPPDPYEDMKLKLNQYLAPERNKTFERSKLRQIRQGDDEKIDSFILRIRQQADRCGGESPMAVEEYVKDQLTTGCRSNDLRKRILYRNDATLNDIVQMARIDEMVAEQTKAFNSNGGAAQSSSVSGDVNKIESKRTYSKAFGGKQRIGQKMGGPDICGRCGYKGHRAADVKCPAKGKQCNKCGGRDHFAVKCYSKDIKRLSSTTAAKEEESKRFKSETVKLVDAREFPGNDEDAESDGDDVFCVVSDTKTGNNIECTIGGIQMKAVIDSGCMHNLIGQNIWKQMKGMGITVSNKQKGTDRTFTGYGGHELPVLGHMIATISVGNITLDAKFYVMEGAGKFLIGLDTAQALGILKVGYDVNAVNDAGVEFSKIKGIVVDIPIDKSIKPVVQPYRRVPVPLEKRVNEKIAQLCQQGIVEEVHGPSKWVSPLVVVPKKDDVRVCLDMRRANEAVERENHILPTFEDFLPHLGEAQVYSKIDIKNAFHQVKN